MAGPCEFAVGIDEEGLVHVLPPGLDDGTVFLKQRSDPRPLLVVGDDPKVDPRVTWYADSATELDPLYASRGSTQDTQPDGFLAGEDDGGVWMFAVLAATPIVLGLGLRAWDLRAKRARR